jgi:hypothetical protein
MIGCEEECGDLIQSACVKFHGVILNLWIQNLQSTNLIFHFPISSQILEVSLERDSFLRLWNQEVIKYLFQSYVVPLIVMLKYMNNKVHLKMFYFHLYIWTHETRKHPNPVWKVVHRQEVFPVWIRYGSFVVLVSCGHLVIGIFKLTYDNTVVSGSSGLSK